MSDRTTPIWSRRTRTDDCEPLTAGIGPVGGHERYSWTNFFALFDAHIMIMGPVDRNSSLFGRVNPVSTVHNHQGTRERKQRHQTEFAMNVWDCG